MPQTRRMRKMALYCEPISLEPGGSTLSTILMEHTELNNTVCNYCCDYSLFSNRERERVWGGRERRKERGVERESESLEQVMFCLVTVTHTICHTHKHTPTAALSAEELVVSGPD